MHDWKWMSLSEMAGFNIRLSLDGRQSSSDKKHNISLRIVLFFSFRCCFAGSLQFSLSTVKRTKLFHSIWMCAKRRCKLQEKAGNLSRNSHTSVASDWTYHLSYAWKKSFVNLTGRIIFFHVWKPSFAPLIGWNSFAYENLRHRFLVSISQYVYIVSMK